MHRFIHGVIVGSFAMIALAFLLGSSGVEWPESAPKQFTLVLLGVAGLVTAMILMWLRRNHTDSVKTSVGRREK
jgi:membrane protein DedA with SNARE-associated domain